MGKSSGVRINFNFNQCEVIHKEGLERAVRLALSESGMEVRAFVVDEFPDDNTATVIFALAESHGGLGSYSDDCHVAGDITVCHYRCDNTAKARIYVEVLERELRPKKADIVEDQWEAL